MVAIDYRYEIGYTPFDDIPGGRIDVFHTDVPSDLDFWFICTSQTYRGGNLPAVNLVELFHIEYKNSAFEKSTLHTYNNWAKCESTHAVSA